MDLRECGKNPRDVNKITCAFGVVSKASGSVYMEQGQTKVLVAVFGPMEIRSKVQPLKMVINCQYSKASFSLPEKKKGLRDQNLTEFARNLKQIFESTIISQFYINSQIDILVEILQDDGAILATSINATTLALTNAGIKLKGLVCSCSCGRLNGKTCVDLNLLEEEQSPSWLTVATLPSVYNQMLLSSMKGKVHELEVDEMIETATKACKDTLTCMVEICSEKLKKCKE